MIAEGRILICDDEEEIRRYLKKLLQPRGYTVETFSNGEALMQRLEPDSAAASFILLDIQMPGQSGIELLRHVKEVCPAVPVAIMTAYGTIDSAVEAIKLGAYDYITKPFPKEKIFGVLEKALEREQLLQENRVLREELQRRSGPGEIIYTSDSFREVVELTRQVAASDANILIQGESGTGKELIARAIHFNSLRRNRRYLTINCAAFSDHLLESQLFGHVKGAFTGAVSSNKGLLQEADRGTLFLDEIGDMSLPIQGKLLRVIQEGEFIPVGSTRPQTVDIRLVAATNKLLDREMTAGRFREDLFYRLNVITISLPPLRERKEDVEPLALHFLKKYAARLNKRLSGIAPAALGMLLDYGWPGNVRELENIIERAVILARGDEITADLLPIGTLVKSAPASVTESALLSLEAMERLHVERALAANGFQKNLTARSLGVSRKTLDRKIADYGLSTTASERP